MSNPARFYGWLNSRPHLSDKARQFRAGSARVVDVPIDWRQFLPPCYDQGQLSSCTANALAAAVQFLQRQQNEPLVMPSRNFLYYNTRGYEGTTGQDCGAMTRDGILSLVEIGVCPETMWPYDPACVCDTPHDLCYAAAAAMELLNYQPVDNTSRADMLAALALGPLVGGFTVYESFESDEVARTGVVPMPGSREQPVGGHAILLVGNLPDQDRYLARNSWSPSWGMDGYFTIPRQYFEDSYLSTDWWRLSLLT